MSARSVSDRLVGGGLLWTLLFLAGAGLRVLDVGRPADGRVRESWRECDYAAVARNFVREGMNILSPRIDWRGDGPGFAEMEFPAVPWAMAVLDKAFGYRESYGRWLMFAASLLTILVFFGLARSVLPAAGALAASAVFVLSPLVIRVSNSLQPEALMLLLEVLAVTAFLRWLDKDAWSSYALAVAATAAAILIKAPAAHLGILFLLLLAGRKGAAAFRRLRVWAFGALSLLPGALWYLHAHRFWTQYGNSLGVSNESHWIGPDLFANPGALLRLLVNLAKLEIGLVWTPVGLAAAAYALILLRKQPAVRLGAAWIAAVGVYYLVAIRTLGDTWAAYYHVASAPAAALLVGAGAVGFLTFFRRRGSGALSPAAWSAAALGLTAVLAFEGVMVIRDLHPKHFQGLYACARSFQALIPEEALIVASGGASRDETGKPVAYNASYMFFWLDRKGFNIPSDGYSLEAAEALVQRGARYFVLEKATLKDAPRFLEGVRSKAVLLAECPEAFLFRF
jgi:4-amino-4-deoxy-L-arabinose transferase-like glycosyltransferase